MYTTLKKNNFFTLLLCANARGKGSNGKGGRGVVVGSSEDVINWHIN